MDNGTLPSNHAQRKPNKKRPQRLGTRAQPAPLYTGFAPKHYQRECANGGYCEWAAESEV